MTLDDLVDPKFHSLVTVARRLIEERCARGVPSPAEQLAVVALAEQPDEGDEAAVRAWQPTSQLQLGGAVRQRETRRYEVTHVPAPVRRRDRALGVGEPAMLMADILLDTTSTTGRMMRGESGMRWGLAIFGVVPIVLS